MAIRPEQAPIQHGAFTVPAVATLDLHEQAVPPAEAEIIRHPNGIGELRGYIGNEQFSAPIYNLREENHKDIVAQRIATGEKFLFHGWGVEGVGQFLRNVRNGQIPEQDLVFFMKGAERGESKVPILAPPHVLQTILDERAIKRPMRELFTNRRLFEQLHPAATAFHLILPVRRTNLHPVFQTHAENWATDPKKKDKPQFWVDHTTVSAMWMPDRDLLDIVNRVELLNDDGMVGCSSFNISGDLPVVRTADVPEYITSPKFLRYNNTFSPRFLLEDPESENPEINTRSSHPQFRPAFESWALFPDKGYSREEKPAWYVYRKGGLHEDNFYEALQDCMGLNFPVVVLPEAEMAKRHDADDVNLSDRLFMLAQRVDDDYTRRNPHKNNIQILFDQTVGRVRRKPAA